VEKFCRAYDQWKAALPEGMKDRQMLVSDKTKTAVCYVPKTGCTTLKVLLFLSLGKQ
jgi:hypothetical protein